MKIGITQGDVNGIGYEVIMKALQDMESIEELTPIIYGSPKAAAYHRKAVGVAQFSLNIIKDAEEAHNKRINIITCGDDNIKVEIGKTSEAAGQAAYDALECATRDLCDGKIDAIVTAPVNHKAMLSETYTFAGQTEFLEHAAQEQSLNIMVADKLKVAYVAGNIPLANVSSFITQDKIVSKLRILNRAMRQDFSIDRPRIAVLGLNPHAGDDGILGKEETDVIAPAIEKAANEGIIAMGPYTADGIFGSDALGKFDAVLAMYHDQAAIPFKTLAYSQSAGATLSAGLPFVRTAAVHGTAYDIVGQDKADCSSFRAAIYLAMDVARTRTQNLEIEANRMTTVAETRRERNA